MNYPKRVTKLCIILLLALAFTTSGHTQVLDRIIAVVDSGIVLESDLKQRSIEVAAQAKELGSFIEIGDKLKAQILERLIVEQAQLEIAKRQGLQIDDARVNETLSQIAKNKGTDLLGLKTSIEKEGKNFSIFRRQIRKELLISAVRDLEVRKKIRISNSELERFIKTTGGQIGTAPELLLSQIVIGLPTEPGTQAIGQAKAKALQIREALIKGASFDQLASRFSSASEATKGGDLGWRNILELNSAFAKPLANAKKNTLIGPIQSESGFHLIAVRDRRGDKAAVVTEYNVRHILIKPDAVRSKSDAKKLAENIRQELLSGVQFDKLATRFSEDPISAAKGGNLDWVRPNNLVAEFADVMTKLPLNVISEVTGSSFGFHLIEVLGQRESDISQQQLKDRARKILKARKYSQEIDSWIRQVRANAFVEIKI
jgi:peptidyl-prolyl cis-trans isomerase SurA